MSKRSRRRKIMRKQIYWRRWWNEFYGLKKKKKKHYVITIFVTHIINNIITQKRLWCSFCSWSSNEVWSIIIFLFCSVKYSKNGVITNLIYRCVYIKFVFFFLSRKRFAQESCGMPWNNCSIKINNSSELTMVRH